jgi:hypothetical protein
MGHSRELQDPVVKELECLYYSEQLDCTVF